MKTDKFSVTLKRLLHEPRVYVRTYVRCRLGRFEMVRAHTRKWPGHHYAPATLH